MFKQIFALLKQKLWTILYTGNTEHVSGAILISSSPQKCMYLPLTMYVDLFLQR